MAQFGVSEMDILHGHETENVQKLLDFQIERAETYYDRAFNELPAEDRKAQRTGLIMAAIYRTLLWEIKADDARKVLNARTSIPPLRKFWLALTTWLKN
jgi:phytoene synthase